MHFNQPEWNICQSELVLLCTWYNNVRQKASHLRQRGWCVQTCRCSWRWQLFLLFSIIFSSPQSIGSQYSLQHFGWVHQLHIDKSETVCKDVLSLVHNISPHKKLLRSWKTRNEDYRATCIYIWGECAYYI